MTGSSTSQRLGLWLILAVLAPAPIGAQNLCPAAIPVQRPPLAAEYQVNAINRPQWDDTATALSAICRGEVSVPVLTGAAPAGACSPDGLLHVAGDSTLYGCVSGSWSAISGGGGGAVSSVFGRAGAVVAASGDYTSTLVTNSSGVSGATVGAALDTLDAGKAAAVHAHAAADVTSGTLASARLPLATTSAAGAVVLATSGEATAGEVVEATDARLTDARTPLAHAATHQQAASDPLTVEALASACVAGATLEGDGAGGLQCGTDETGGVGAPTVAALMIVRDEAPSGTEGGGAVAATWTTRALDTVLVNTIAGASLAGNAITLPAGDYLIQARAPGYYVGRHRIRLYDTGASAVLAVGASAFSTTSGASGTVSDAWMQVRLSLASSTTMRLEHWTETTKTINGLGVASSVAGVAEVYASLVVQVEAVAGDQTAAEVPFAPAGGIAATDVQAALEEVDAEHTVDTDDQTATEVPYTPAVAGDWIDPDPTQAGGALDDLAGRLTAEEARVDDDVPEDADLGSGTADSTTFLRGDRTWATPPSGGASSGSGLQHGDGAGGFSEVTGSSVDGAKVTVAGGISNGLCFGDADACLSEDADDLLYFKTPTIDYLFIGTVSSGYTGIGFNVSGSQGAMIRSGPTSATVPTLLPRRGDNSGIGQASAGDIRGIAAGVSAVGWTTTEATLYVEQVNAPATQTCASSGDASAGFLAVTVSGRTFIKLTNSDPDGCAASISETGATDGQRLEVVLVSSAGGTVSLADSAGVQETGAGCSLAVWGAATLRYATDRWVMIGCQPTN